MISIKTGKDHITGTNWLTTWFSKFPGTVFKESRLFFNFQVFSSVETAQSLHWLKDHSLLTNTGLFSDVGLYC